jgi:hypothetical protein
MMVARMNRLSTPVELATSRMDSWIAEISSGLLRATSQASQDSSIWFWLAENLAICQLIACGNLLTVLTNLQRIATGPRMASLHLQCHCRCSSGRSSQRSLWVLLRFLSGHWERLV